MGLVKCTHKKISGEHEVVALSVWENEIVAVNLIPLFLDFKVSKLCVSIYAV